MYDIVQDVVGGVVQSPGYWVVQSPTGPQGAPSQVGLLFSFPGYISQGEPAVPGSVPTQGAYSVAGSLLDCEVGASTPSAFPIYMRPPGGSFSLFAMATFAPGGNAIVFTGSGAYPAGAYFKCQPPAAPDAQLYGPTIVLGGP